jgi:Ser/Thr protein kinase RdoA (MazF antagonist)
MLDRPPLTDAQVAAALRDRDGIETTTLEGLFLVVYPFLDAPIAADAGLTDAQWVAYGDVVGRLHRTSRRAGSAHTGGVGADVRPTLRRPGS